MSTDQFAGAADIEAAGLGMVFDPNHDAPAVIAEMAASVLSGDAVLAADDLGRRLRHHPGPSQAASLVQAV